MSPASTVEIATIVRYNENETSVNVEMANHRCARLRAYFAKWYGQHKEAPPPVKLSDCIITFLGTFIGISILAVVHFRIVARHVGQTILSHNVVINNKSFFPDIILFSLSLHLPLRQ
jgi:hypothetical protein